MIDQTTPQPVAPSGPAPITKLGDALVLGHACGFRIDRIMGVHDYRAIQLRLIEQGYLRIDGEPTTAGDKACDAFLAERDRQQRAAREAAEKTQPPAEPKDN